MTTERCAQYEIFKRADRAFRNGDLEELKAALGDPPDFPNARGPQPIRCSCLQYAIYHSPLPFIRTLLELGADPNYDDYDGFPSLMAALSAIPTEQHPGRSDVYEIVELLLSFGADVDQRGINDFTPLHHAAAIGDTRFVEMLLAHGANPGLQTRIDDYETPIELAERCHHPDVVRMLRDR